MDPVLYEQPALTHSFLGAKMAERDFGITDDDILNAIKYHTTGRAGMSLLEKIVYIADCIEPNREYYSGLKEIRELAYVDIDKAMKFALKNTWNIIQPKVELYILLVMRLCMTKRRNKMTEETTAYLKPLRLLIKH